jgi:hypothetical protein
MASDAYVDAEGSMTDPVAPYRGGGGLAVKQAMNPMQSENILEKIRENQIRSSNALLSRRN